MAAKSGSLAFSAEPLLLQFHASHTGAGFIKSMKAIPPSWVFLFKNITAFLFPYCLNSCAGVPKTAPGLWWQESCHWMCFLEGSPPQKALPWVLLCQLNTMLWWTRCCALPPSRERERVCRATAEALTGFRLFARHRLMLCILLGFVAVPELPINAIFLLNFHELQSDIDCWKSVGTQQWRFIFILLGTCWNMT